MRILFTVQLLFVLLFLSLSAAAQEPTRLTLLLPWLPQAQFAGVYQAKEAGIFARHGLDVEIRHKKPGDSLFAPLTQGEAQFVIAPLAAALQERAAGVPLVNICQLGQHGNIMLVGSAKNGVSKVAELRKRDSLRIGVWEGGDSHAIPLLFLRQQGIQQGVVPFDSGVAPFLWGAVNWIFVMEYNEYYKLLAAGYTPGDLTTFRMREHQLNIPEDGVYTLSSTLAATPKQCVSLRTALLEGWREALRNPPQTLKLVRLYAERDNGRFDPAHQLWMLNVFGKSLDLDSASAGTLPQSAYEATTRLFRRTGVIERNASYREFCPGSRGETELPAEAEK